MINHLITLTSICVVVKTNCSEIRCVCFHFDNRELTFLSVWIVQNNCWWLMEIEWQKVVRSLSYVQSIKSWFSPLVRYTVQYRNVIHIFFNCIHFHFISFHLHQKPITQTSVRLLFSIIMIILCCTCCSE